MKMLNDGGKNIYDSPRNVERGRKQTLRFFGRSSTISSYYLNLCHCEDDDVWFSLTRELYAV